MLKEKVHTKICNRCGACCFVVDDFCPYLRRDKKNKAVCLIYNNPKRIGLKIAEGYVCGYRSLSKYDFPGCPYNSGKAIHPHFGGINGA